MGRPYLTDEERRARNRGAIYHGHHEPAPVARAELAAADKTPVTVVGPIQRRRETRALVKGIALGVLAALVGVVAGAFLGGCAPVQKPSPKLGASLIFPGGSSGGGASTVTANQGTAAAGSSAWPVAVTNTSDTIVKTGDSVNNAIRVNVVAGGAAGGTSSSFGAAIPATGTAAGQSDGTNMQLPRVFDGDTGAGTQYVSGSILRKSASGGTVEAGTSTDPLRVDPTGTTTQPVSGTVTITPSGTQTVAGNLTNNNAAPAGTLVGAMPAIANAAAPTWTEGRLVLNSVDLGGSLRTVLMNSTIAVTQSGSWSLAANQSVNVAQINGVTPLMGNGVTGTGSPRVTIASDNTAFTVNAAQSGTWTVQPGNTANTTPWLVIGNAVSGDTCCATAGLRTYSAQALTSPSSFTSGTLRPLQIDADNGGLRVAGSAEHDAVGTTSDPVLIGGYASAAAPTNVSADGDAVRQWHLRSGALVNQQSYAGTLATTGTGAADGGTQRVAVASDSTITPRTVSSANNTGTCTSVTTSSTTVLASNASRKAYGLKAASTNTQVAFCKLGATATTSNVPFEAGSSWSQDNGAVYTGVIDCITASSTASVCVFEMN